MPDPALFARFQRDFLGATPRDAAAAGGRRRIYLDAAATSLMPRVALEAQAEYYAAACANPHTQAHAAGRASTHAVARTRVLLGRLVGYDPLRDEVVFCGAGATGAINRAARALFPDGPAAPGDRRAPLAVVTALEHHSHLLPWRRAAGAAHVRAVPACARGGVDLAALEKLLRDSAGRVRVVAVTAASNVTGVIIPVHAVARLAHRFGARIVVDGAQAAPHLPLAMHAPDGGDLDALAVSGHKLYAPGAPGVLVCARTLFARDGGDGAARGPVGDAGGGTVESVPLLAPATYKRDLAAREEAGTPNTPGVVALGTVAALLHRVGMDAVSEHDAHLTERALARLGAVEGVILYGSPDPRERVGVVAFNLPHVPHGVVARMLSDRFGIEVRNGCFCAEPFVRELLDRAARAGTPTADECPGQPPTRRGMVRASFGPWTTDADVDALAGAVAWIAANEAAACGLYRPDGSGGGYVDPELFAEGEAPCFSLDEAVARYARGS
jgi:selenocysteine lyase/cysteine desulfurase